MSEPGSTDQPDTIAIATTRSLDIATAATRREHDLLGETDVPAEAYWGVHTLRAVENFPITGVCVGHFPELVRALAMVKQAAARANKRLGLLAPHKADAIEHACNLIAIDGKFKEQFVVDAVQGGAGTSTNMNANEVIANVALEFLGKPKGDYASLHPNDDVNMTQSTNDAYPTALRLAIILSATPLIKALDALAFAFKEKAVEFGDVLKIGRTQLQDAVPMTLGQEFDAYFATIKEDVARLREAATLFREMNLGATAIGTGINADPRYAALAIEELGRVSGEPLVLAGNLIEATSDMGAFVFFSGVLKRVAVKLSKICNDLRLLSSGPRAGFGEIRLPTVQAGSVDHAGQDQPGDSRGGEPGRVPGHRPRSYRYHVRRGRPASAQRLRADDRLLHPDIAEDAHIGHHDAQQALRRRPSRPTESAALSLAQDSIGLVTALGPALGYEACSRIAKRALKEKRRVADIVLEEGLLTADELDQLLRIEAMTAPMRRVAHLPIKPS